MDERLFLLCIEIARLNVDEARSIHEADVKIIGLLCKTAESRVEDVEEVNRR